MITFVVLALWLVMLLSPETPIGRAILHWTVVRPAARLDRITRGQVLFVLLLATGASLVGWLIGHESVRLMAMGLPDLIVWATMFEVTAYLDAIAAVVTIASVTRFSAVKAWGRTVFPSRRPAKRERRAKPLVREPANDEDSRPAYTRAA